MKLDFYEIEVWRESSLKLAIIKNPNMELKQSIEAYLANKYKELPLTDKEFTLCVNALLEHATFKGFAWIENEYKMVRNKTVAHDFLKYGPSSDDYVKE